MVMYHRAHMDPAPSGLGGQPTIGPITGYVGHIWPCAVRWGPNSAWNLQCWHIVSLLQAYMSPHCGPLSALLSVGSPQSTHIMGNPTGHIWALHFPTGLCKVWVCKPLLLPNTCPKGTGSDWEPISCLNFSLWLNKTLIPCLMNHLKAKTKQKEGFKTSCQADPVVIFCVHVIFQICHMSMHKDIASDKQCFGCIVWPWKMENLSL